MIKKRPIPQSTHHEIAFRSMWLFIFILSLFAIGIALGVILITTQQDELQNTSKENLPWVISQIEIDTLKTMVSVEQYTQKDYRSSLSNELQPLKRNLYHVRSTKHEQHIQVLPSTFDVFNTYDALFTYWDGLIKVSPPYPQKKLRLLYNKLKIAQKKAHALGVEITHYDTNLILVHNAKTRNILYALAFSYILIFLTGIFLAFFGYRQTKLAQARFAHAHLLQKRFRAFAHSACDWFWETNDKDQLLYTSRSGRDRKPLNPKVFMWIAHFHLLKTKTPFRDIVHEIKSMNGKVHFFRLTGQPQYNTQNTFTGYRGTATNITRQVSLQRKAAQLERQARIAAIEANKTKSEFLAMMSHEIRTPLHGIMGMLTLLHDSKLSKKQYEQLNIALDSAQSLLNIINNILDLSKIQAGHMTLEHHSFNPMVTMNNVAQLFESLALAKNIELHVNLHPSVDGSFLGDRERLRQVLINLLGNAIKFTQKGSIRLHAYARNKTSREKDLMIYITDTGIGIESQSLPYIFSSFQQVDPSHSRKYGGSGLGLSITKKLIHLMNGQIFVKSKKQKGTIFQLIIPFVLSPQKTLSIKQTSSFFQSTSKPSLELTNIRILLAEDSPTNQIIAKTFLTKRGAIVTCVTNGKEAIEAAKHQTFNIILMDISMPIIDGFEATKIIKKTIQKNKQTPILALTAHVMTQDIERYRKSGFSGHISKPIHPDTLYQKIRAHLPTHLLQKIDTTPPKRSP